MSSQQQTLSSGIRSFGIFVAGFVDKARNAANRGYLLAGMIALATLACAAADDPAPGWHQGFEESLPGAMPGGWRRLFGDPEFNGDAVSVGNLRTLTGDKSFVIERPVGVGVPWRQYGLATPLPAMTNAWARLTIPFLVEGETAYMVSFTFEIRAKDGRTNLAEWRLANDEMKLLSGNRESGGILGAITRGEWYRASLWLPGAPEGGAGSAFGMLERHAPDGAWQRMGEVVEIPCAAGLNQGGIIVLCPGPGQGRTLYLDDLRLDSDSSAPARRPAKGTR